MTSTAVRLTQYSHGAGCGCKLSPSVLSTILKSNIKTASGAPLLVGNQTRDDAAAVDLGDGTALLSTTDFFMPIVDDPFDFGRIAATNAISDIYAMGGTPLVAIAILGWPIDTLSAEIAQQVVEGGRQTCLEANITLAGGHSIDSPEPFFGLAVTGRVPLKQLKRNDTATAGSKLLLSKPLGVGALTTAEKRGELPSEHADVARDSMCALNTVGIELATIDGVSAITDVTGFGLLGHLQELCVGSNVGATVRLHDVPLLAGAAELFQSNCVPGGTARNYASYQEHVRPLSALEQAILCDPQTSGGLLVVASPGVLEAVHASAARAGIKMTEFGITTSRDDAASDHLIQVI